MSTNRRSAIDTLLTALAPVIWGSTYIVTTELLPPDRPVTAAMIRALPAGVLLLIYCRRIPLRADWGRLAVLAFLNIGLFQVLLFLAAYRLPGGVAAVAGSIQPILMMLLVWAMERRRPAALGAIAGVTGIAGMAALLLSPKASWDWIGVVAALLGAASMAAGTYLSRRWRPDLPVMAFTGWQLLLGGAMLIPLACFVDPPLPPLNATHIAAYLYLSMAGALLAYSLWFRGIARLPPVAVSSLGLLSPVTAVVLGWILLGQSMTGISLAGLILVLASVLGVQFNSQLAPVRR